MQKLCDSAGPARDLHDRRQVRGERLALHVEDDQGVAREDNEQPRAVSIEGQGLPHELSFV